jgi:hypothetical protein
MALTAESAASCSLSWTTDETLCGDLAIEAMPETTWLKAWVTAGRKPEAGAWELPREIGWYCVGIAGVSSVGSKGSISGDFVALPGSSVATAKQNASVLGGIGDGGHRGSGDSNLGSGKTLGDGAVGIPGNGFMSWFFSQTIPILVLSLFLSVATLPVLFFSRFSQTILHHRIFVG